MTVDLTRYTGFLATHMIDIMKRYSRGESVDEMAFYYTRLLDTYCGKEHILYALRRIGFIEPAPEKPIGKGGERRQRLIAQRNEYVVLPGGETGKGRPIDMGGPRDVWIEDCLCSQHKTRCGAWHG